MSNASSGSPISPLQRRNSSMIDRRTFINTGLMASAAVMGAAAQSRDLGASSTAPIGAILPLHLAIFDSRFVHCRRFGAAMNTYGVPSAGFHGDVTNLWFAGLDPVWRSRPVSIAGMTSQGVLFCLERLAWDHGMRVVYRGTHRPIAGGGVDHMLESSAKRPHFINNRLSGLDSWPGEIASLISNISDPLPDFPSQSQTLARVHCRSRPGRTHDDVVEPAYSWVIAPRSELS